jgi:hypothetical protein
MKLIKDFDIFKIDIFKIDEEEESQNVEEKEQESSFIFKIDIDIFKNIYYDNYPLVNGCDDNWTWIVKGKSRDIVRFYGSKRRIVEFHPSFSLGSEGVRGNRILNNARFYWELNVSMKIYGFR